MLLFLRAHFRRSASRLELGALSCALLLGGLSCSPASGPRPGDTPGSAPAPASAEGAIPIDARNDPGVNVTLTVPLTVQNDTIDLPADEVWLRLPRAYASLGLTIEAADPKSQSLGTGRLRVHRYLKGRYLGDYMRCGRTVVGENVDTHEIEMRVRSTVETAGASRAALRTLVSAVANQSGAGQSSFRCTSTRGLERKLVELIRGPQP